MVLQLFQFFYPFWFFLIFETSFDNGIVKAPFPGPISSILSSILGLIISIIWVMLRRNYQEAMFKKWLPYVLLSYFILTFVILFPQDIRWMGNFIFDFKRIFSFQNYFSLASIPFFLFKKNYSVN